MSLVVNARRRGSDVWLTPSPPRNELAGFESWRHEVWGSPVLKRLGLRILPSLADQDVFASGPDLAALDAEVKLLQSALHAVVDELYANRVDRAHLPEVYEDLEFRLANIAEAVRLARAIPGGDGEVVIW